MKVKWNCWIDFNKCFKKSWKKLSNSHEPKKKNPLRNYLKRSIMEPVGGRKTVYGKVLKFYLSKLFWNLTILSFLRKKKCMTVTKKRRKTERAVKSVLPCQIILHFTKIHFKNIELVQNWLMKGIGFSQLNPDYKDTQSFILVYIF